MAKFIKTNTHIINTEAVLSAHIYTEGSKAHPQYFIHVEYNTKDHEIVFHGWDEAEAKEMLNSLLEQANKD